MRIIVRVSHAVLSPTFLASITLLSLIAPLPTHADQLILENGLVLKGMAVRVPGMSVLTAQQNNSGPVPQHPFWLVDDGVRRYFVPARRVREQIGEDELSRLVRYDFKHDKKGRNIGVDNVDAPLFVQPFDKFGIRTLSLNTRAGQIDIIQGITQLRPDYAKIEGLNYVWEMALDTRVIPDDVIESLIEIGSDRSDPKERKAAVYFYIQAQLYTLAQRELEQISKEFPELNDWSAELHTQIAQLKARQALEEIKQRRAAGQHRLAWQIAKLFPAELVSPDVLREAREIADGYAASVVDRDHAVMLLDIYQAQLEPQAAEQLRSLRPILISELHYGNLHRLRPFLRAEQDESLSISQKLALAYSGWLVGEAEAILELSTATRLWEARFLIQEYLRTTDNPFRSEELLKALTELEGLNVNRVAQMIPNLPLPFEPPPAVPGDVATVEVPAATGTAALTYSLILPPEYSPHHKYPLLVCLASGRRSIENELRWWAGDAAHPGWAARRGYIVIAPHYADEKVVEYNYQESAHAAVQGAIDHVRQRFHVDSDRIFLAGHGMGGDACFDIGLSHPDLFAGVIPITGICDQYATYYWENGPHLAWYVVGGQRDRNSLERNARDLNKMMKTGQDVIYCDYKERGYETYHEELPRIFDWMELRRRTPLKDIMHWEAASLRRSESRFYWMEAKGLPDRLYAPISWDVPNRRIRPVPFSGDITPGGTIYLAHPGSSTTLWLTPELVNFEERVKVRVKGANFNDYVTPSVKAMLEELQLHGDRERLFWAKLEL